MESLLHKNTKIYVTFENQEPCRFQYAFHDPWKSVSTLDPKEILAIEYLKELQNRQ